ncbi:MAG: hypothetical protein AB7R00_09865 [Kofleriaceae bacterium]
MFRLRSASQKLEQHLGARIRSECATHAQQRSRWCVEMIEAGLPGAWRGLQHVFETGELRGDALAEPLPESIEAWTRDESLVLIPPVGHLFVKPRVIFSHTGGEIEQRLRVDS